MMLRYSFGLMAEGAAVERAVEETFRAGFRTRDIYEEGKTLLGTREFCNEVLARL